MTHSASRREFLKAASIVSGSVGAAGVPFALNLATLGTAAAQSGGSYKAIVCLFLYGGNDSANMVLPTDATSWANYTTTRNQGTDPISLRAVGTPANAAATGMLDCLGGVLPITPNFAVNAVQNSGRTFALHPSMAGVKALFDAQRLGVIANAGPLGEPPAHKGPDRARP